MSVAVGIAMHITKATGRNLDPNLNVTVRPGFVDGVWVVSVSCSQHYSGYEFHGQLRAFAFAAQLLAEINQMRSAAGVPEIGICP